MANSLVFNPLSGNLDLVGSGGGGGSGTVTSVGVTMPADFSVSGSPVTGAGTVAITRVAAAATKTGTFSLANTDTIVRVDNTSSAFAGTMPSPSANVGRSITLINVGTGTNLITINPNSAETFGQPAYTAIHLSTPGESWTLMSDGTNWQILAHYASTAPATFTMSLYGSGSNPTKGTVVVDTASWYRVGNRIHITWSYQQSAAGTAGSGTVGVTGWPTAYAANTSLLTAGTANFRHCPGSSYIWLPANSTAFTTPLLIDSTHIGFTESGTATPLTSGVLTFAATGTSTVGLDVNFPVTNWEP